MRIVVSTQNQHQNDGFLEATLVAPQFRDGKDLKRNLSTSLQELRRHCGDGEALTRDFLFLASLCYLIDKMVRRAWSSNGWTRDLDVTLPVSQPDVWNNAATELAQALSFLSGDLWTLRFVQLDHSHWKPQSRSLFDSESKADGVSLFSGGLDSLVGVTDFLAGNPSSHILLVGHRDGAAKEQNRIFEPLQEAYPERAKLIRIRVGHRVVEDSFKAVPENTLRSRSLVFLALGIYAARSQGAQTPLLAPENGVIALNMPLTPSRVGSCSTRTMHPYFLEKLRGVLRKVGLLNPILNPLENKTKGEILSECLNPVLLQIAAPQSVSCSHASRRQHWQRRQCFNCGYCVPCLFRRAALHNVSRDKGSDYGVDICAGEMLPSEDSLRSNDLRAMLHFISRNLTQPQLAEEIRVLVPIDNLEKRAAMIERGFQEVREWLKVKGTPDLHQAAGIASPTRN